jgi:hypothetical protein
MNIGIQILIERMKTNPEEFVTPQVINGAKWETILNSYWKYLSEEDKAAYQQARDAIIQDEFTEVVMKKLAGVGDEDGVALSSKAHPVATGSLRMNQITNQFEIYDGNQWIETNKNVMYRQQEALRVSTQNNDINQLHNSYQGMQQYGAGGLGGAIGGGNSSNTLYAGGGGGGSMLSNLAKGLGFK